MQTPTNYEDALLIFFQDYTACRLAWEKARELESQRDRYAEELEYQKAAECDTSAKVLYTLLAEISSLPNVEPIHGEKDA